MHLQRLLICGTVAIVDAVPLALGSGARAHDSLAPPGAGHNWLPQASWVRHHWVPFDEAHLEQALGIDSRQLYDWLADDHRTLAQLARAKGHVPRELVEHLIAPHGSTPVLRRHARRVFGQGHLAQHLFFHLFHGPHVPRHARTIVGVSRAEYLRLRQLGLTPIQIARRAGRSPHHLRVHMLAHLRREAARGVARGMTSEAQSQAIVARQERLLGCWMRSPHAKFDRDSPYGDPLSGHGPHPRDSRIGIVDGKVARGCWLPLTQ